MVESWYWVVTGCGLGVEQVVGGWWKLANGMPVYGGTGQSGTLGLAGAGRLCPPAGSIGGTPFCGLLVPGYVSVVGSIPCPLSNSPGQAREGNEGTAGLDLIRVGLDL